MNDKHLNINCIQTFPDQTLIHLLVRVTKFGAKRRANERILCLNSFLSQQSILSSELLIWYLYRYSTLDYLIHEKPILMATHNSIDTNS